MYYWIKHIGDDSFKIFLMELNGNLFVSSDKYFPNYDLMYDILVEQSQAYWNQKNLPLIKNFHFKEKVKLLNNNS